MRFEIGAMSVGDILDRGLKLLLARLPTFYFINLIVLAPLILVQLALPAIAVAAASRQPSTDQLAATMVATFVVLLLALILQPFGTAAMLHVISKEFVGERVGLGAAFSFALRRFGRLLWASIVAGLVIGVGFVLCIVPGIIFWIWYAFVAQVVVVEGLQSTHAMGRSKELGAGFRLRIFGLLLLFIVIAMVFQYVVGMIELVLPSTERVPVDEGPGVRFQRGYEDVFIYRSYAIQIIALQIVNILVQTYQAICLTLLYFDLRIRKEGFDLELAARQQS